jgi:hypothetical protein
VLLAKVANLREFAGILIVDKLLGNADSRQCVFTARNAIFRPLQRLRPHLQRAKLGLPRRNQA